MNAHEKARALMVPTDNPNSAEGYLKTFYDIYSNPKHLLHSKIVGEYQALLRSELGPAGELPLNEGSQ